jgi:hypothetical protein
MSKKLNSKVSQPPRHQVAAIVSLTLGIMLVWLAYWTANMSAAELIGAIKDFLRTNKELTVPLVALTGLTLAASSIVLFRRDTGHESAKRYVARSVYEMVQDYAYPIKAILQMAIGVIAVALVGWEFLHESPLPTKAATSLLLDGIGVGLAAAAVVELAYTLFTAGPDEALDPLMLAVSAALLIQLGGLELGIAFEEATGLLALGVLLAVLFGTKLMLAERHDGTNPEVWWIGRRRSTSGRPEVPPP